MTIPRPRLCLVLATFALHGACDQPPAPAEPVLRLVRVVEVFATGSQQSRTFSGVARAGTESTLSFRVPGTVQRLPVAVGDRVRSGQLIAELDDVDFELRVSEAEAALRQAEAQATNSQADLRRVRGLFENDNASRDDLDAGVAVAASTQAQVEAASKRLELAERQVSYTHLAAPVAGAIAEVRTEVNENVAAGQAVVVLTSGVQPEVEVSVPESLITQIAEGSEVSVRFDALAGQAVAGIVTEVAVTASGLATTFPVSVQLRGEAQDVRPGMAADVTFEFAGAAAGDRFVVPAEAVGEDRQGRFVFVAEPAGDDRALVRRRSVEVGAFAPNGLEVLQGLLDGDLVVTAGVNQIDDGCEVRLGPSQEG